MDSKNIHFYIFCFYFILCGCSNTEPVPTNNTNINQVTYQENLNAACNSNDVNCLENNQSYIMVNSGYSPIDLIKYKFGKDHDNYYYLGTSDDRFELEPLDSECRKFRVRKIGNGNIIREMEIIMSNDSLLKIHDPMICPSGECLFINENYIQNYYSFVCSKSDCNCVEAYCECEANRGGYDCENVLDYFELYNADNIQSFVEYENDIFFIDRSSGGLNLMTSLIRSKRDLTVEDKIDLDFLNQNSNNVLKKKSNDLYLFSYYLDLGQYKIDAYKFNFNSQTLSIINSIDVQNGGGSFPEKLNVYYNGDECIFHIENYSNHLLVRLDANLNKIVSTLVNADHLDFFNNKIVGFSFFNESRNRSIQIDEYSSTNFQLLSSVEKEFLPKPNLNLDFLVDFVSIKGSINNQNEIVFLCEGLFNDLDGDGLESSTALVRFDANYNLKRTKKLFNSVSYNNFSFAQALDGVYLTATSSDLGNSPFVVKFTENKTKDFHYFHEFQDYTFKPRFSYVGPLGNIYTLGDGNVFGNNILNIRFNDFSVYNYPGCN